MAVVVRRIEAPVRTVEVGAYTIPTESPESDGTLEWDRTTLVVVEVEAADRRGVGYTYATPAVARLVADVLARVVGGLEALAVPAAWQAMVSAVRNLGEPGVAASAISAVDTALWDLKARLLDVPLVTLLGATREAVPIYGSGGFTSYPIERLQEQLAGWVAQGITRVKMKVGRQPDRDVERVRAAREAIGPDAELLIDANGAYGRKQALALAGRFTKHGVSWFEEPVPSDDLEGLRFLRERAPVGMEIAAGEYGYELGYFRRMLEAGAVDVLQADATRCGGITGFLRAADLALAFGVPLSAHTAPALHVHPCCAAPGVRHIEYFHDHVRIERLLFSGAPVPAGGSLRPDPGRLGLGLELKRMDAARYSA